MSPDSQFEGNSATSVETGISTSQKPFLPNVAIADMAGGTMDEVIHELLVPFQNHDAVEDLHGWGEALIRREKLQPTVSAQGIAFPHARTNAVRKILWAAGVSKAGLALQANGPRVHLVILVGVPERMVREYLNFMGRLARGLRAEGAVERLIGSKTDEQLKAGFSELEI